MAERIKNRREDEDISWLQSILGSGLEGAGGALQFQAMMDMMEEDKGGDRDDEGGTFTGFGRDQPTGDSAEPKRKDLSDFTSKFSEPTAEEDIRRKIKQPWGELTLERVGIKPFFKRG